MKRIFALVLVTVLASCGGGGKDGQMDPPTPTGPTNTGTPTAAGDPSNADFIELGAQLSSMGVDQIVQALTNGTGSTSPNGTLGLNGPLELRRPSQNVSRTAGYFCCGPQAASRSYITVTTSITLTPGTGALGILQSFGSFTETEWSSTVANNWRIDLSKLRIEGDLATTGSTVNGSQQLRLVGTLRYTMPNASTKDVVVDVRFQYANFEDNSPAATGTMGAVNITGQSTTPLIMPGRCSRPREGCGPTVNGDAPCTVWPRCPAT